MCSDGSGASPVGVVENFWRCVRDPRLKEDVDVVYELRHAGAEWLWMRVCTPMNESPPSDHYSMSLPSS